MKREAVAMSVESVTVEVPQVKTIRLRWPDMEIVAGGGVRNPQDAQELIAAGADAVLVATALHRGRWKSFDAASKRF